MSRDQRILESHYSQGRPFVKARVVVINPETLRQTTIEKDFWIDTGFDGGVHLAKLHEDDITSTGLNVWRGTAELAGGVSAAASYCLAYLQQIEDHEFPAPGIEVEVLLQGSKSHGLIGLSILRNWIVNLDGPKELLTIAKP